ncbi:MAG: HupE/UreJ family protein [Pelistega sp.]|nr:HupE/UreJ family protein [Pelistega sp.]
MKFSTRYLAPIALLSSIPSLVLAHPGHEHAVEVGGFLSGLSHPIGGLDHLLAMLAVGLWSALSFNQWQKILTAPFSFVLVLALGALFALAGFSLPAVEPIILVSLMVLGLLCAMRLKLSSTLGALIVAAFALAHGMAHGAELPLGQSATLYILGFLLSTMVIHSVGIALGLWLKDKSHWFTRILGGATCAYGAALLLGA